MGTPTDGQWLKIQRWAVVLGGQNEDVVHELIVVGADAALSLRARSVDWSDDYVFVSMRSAKKGASRKTRGKRERRLSSGDALCGPDSRASDIRDEIFAARSKLLPWQRRVFDAFRRRVVWTGRYWGIQTEVAYRMGVSKQTVGKAIQAVRGHLGNGGI